jgi:membrane protease YdiL (CAAX protease family)
MVKPPTVKVSRTTLLNFTILVEGLLLLVATVWSKMVGLELAPRFVFDYKALLLGLITGLLMAGFGYLLLLSRHHPVLRQLRHTVDDMLIPLVQDLRPADMILIAVLSGFCEEVFFRAVAQQKFGLVLTSIAFGLFHDPSFRNLSYTFLALGYGVVLGLLFQYTGNIWAPIVAHAVHNLITLWVLRYWMKPPASPVES